MGQAIAVAIVLVIVATLLSQLSSSGASGDAPAGGGGVATVRKAAPLNSKIQALAQAIATAEGFGVPGAVPTRANNPGDLVFGDQGYGVANSEGVTIYPDVASGFGALYYELNLIFTGQSKVYTLDMTFAKMAQLWTGGDQSGAWAANVVSVVGASVNETLGDWFNS
jgi:hypothetical protein